MARRDAERLKAYLEMITRKRGGLDVARAAAKDLTERSPTGPSGVLESLRATPAADAGVSGIDKLALNQDLSAAEFGALEAIILPDLRPAVDIIGGKFTVTHSLWKPIFDDEKVRQRVERAIPSIGRIELPGNKQYPYGGTGFVVGKGLLMTNRHVAQIFASGLGDRRLDFIAGAQAGINFVREQGHIDDGKTFMVDRIVMIHPYWDMALLAVKGLDGGPDPLKLSLSDARDLPDRNIAVIGYPAFDPRNPSDVQQQVMGGRYNVKRLQPGELKAAMGTASFGKVVRAATHDCSTLGGNSGSALIDLDTGEVLGLHFGGEYQKQNYAVPAEALGQDSRIVDAGVQFAGNAPGGANDWLGWWKDADAMEAADDSDPGQSTSAAAAPVRVPTPSAAVTTAGGGLTIEVPLRITLSLGAPAGATSVRTESVAIADAGLEAMVEPDHDTKYATRQGYDPNFLNTAGLAELKVPLPAAADPGVLAKTSDGQDVLDYQNFSLRMHAQRRIALVTASNVTKEKKLKRPEPDGDYTRKGLSGLGKNDQEKWFLDTRLDDKYQLPDVFFTKDRGAFDKGHIVRRDDVAWGKTYAALRRANGDTYHVTNCSPQVAGFNRSASGEDNWGDLENLVLAQAANERLCVFAGPLLKASDEVFVGKGDGGTTIRAKIPVHFWKIVVTRGDDGLMAYGFVLEQDLSDVQWEFAVPANFVKTMRRISEIETMTGVAFHSSIRDADQHDTLQGQEIAARAGMERK
jgi:endonuclease G